jgi:beta-galactosidase
MLRLKNAKGAHMYPCNAPTPRVSVFKFTAAQGTVKARVRVRNSSSAASSTTVTTTLLDAAGTMVATGTAKLTIDAGAVAEPVLELTVPLPHLWQGRTDPYLYKAMVEVTAAGGATDRVVQPLAFRTLRIDPKRGCFLNDKPYDLHGANLHQERAGKGWNATNADREEDLSLMYDMGCTFVRLPHYQHDQSTYDICDRLGLLVWAENCLVDRITDSNTFTHNNVEQLTDLIRQNYNHPCILTWSIGNEVRRLKGPDPTPLLKTLAGVVRREDSSRPSAIAACKNEAPDLDGADLIAHNKYFGWYGGGLPKDFASWLDSMHSKYPKACIGISEYGAGANTRQHELPANKPKAAGDWHPEEWQNTYHEASWITLKQRSWVWCKEVWAFCDFASDGRHEGDQPGINDKGLVTRDRKLKKDSYFWYQANWTDAPMAYITSLRFVNRTAATTEVKVYSNCTEVELLVNGTSQGVKPVVDCRAIW